MNSYADFPKKLQRPYKISGGWIEWQILNQQKRELKLLKRKLYKTAIKKFEAAVAANNAEEAKALFVKATKSLDMAAQKGVVHQNMAARKKSRLAAKLNAMA